MTDVSVSTPIVLIQLDRKKLEIFADDIETTEFWVDMSHYDGYMSLWERFSKEARTYENMWNQSQNYDWKCENHTTYVTIAYWYYIDKPHQRFPITIDLRWALIDNVRVGFFTSYSQITNVAFIRNFLQSHSTSYKAGLLETALNFNPSYMMQALLTAKANAIICPEDKCVKCGMTVSKTTGECEC